MIRDLLLIGCLLAGVALGMLVGVTDRHGCGADVQLADGTCLPANPAPWRRLP